MNNTRNFPVARQETNHKVGDSVLSVFDKRIAVLEALHFDIGARLGKAKIRHLHTYNYADIVPLEVDHTLIPA
jgi:hypothetical protein